LEVTCKFEFQRGEYRPIYSQQITRSNNRMVPDLHLSRAPL